MKKLILILSLSLAINVKAQNYTFSKTNDAYFSLSGATILINSNWATFEKGLKLPFKFKFWGATLGDSIYMDDYGSLSINDSINEEISFLAEELHSRGVGKTTINYITEGTTPNRILKVEYKNVGFTNDLPGLKDSASLQCWLYETSNIIEFRYGTNKVKSTSWSDAGPYVGLYLNDLKFLILEGDPLNPTINKTDLNNSQSLTGMPINGTTYRFTPSTSGIKEPDVQIKIIQNKILLPASVQVKSIHVYNSTGQLVQSVSHIEQADLTALNHGIYFIVVNTSNGIISEKKFL